MYFEHFGRVSKSARYAGWLSFRVRKNIYIGMNGSQCNRFRIGTGILNRGAFTIQYGIV